MSHTELFIHINRCECCYTKAQMSAALCECDSCIYCQFSCLHFKYDHLKHAHLSDTSSANNSLHSVTQLFDFMHPCWRTNILFGVCWTHLCNKSPSWTQKLRKWWSYSDEYLPELWVVSSIFVSVWSWFSAHIITYPLLKIQLYYLWYILFVTAWLIHLVLYCDALSQRMT